MIDTIIEEMTNEIMKNKKEKDEEKILHDIIMLYENKYNTYLDYILYCRKYNQEIIISEKHYEYICKLRNEFHHQYEEVNRFG